MATLAASPLSADQWRQITDARKRRAKLDRAAKVAMVGGWVTAILAVCCAPFALMGWESAVMAAGMGIVAYHEFKGRQLLLAADPRGPRVLGWNQVGFAALIIVYSLWQIVTTLTGPGPYVDAIRAEPMLAQSLGPIQHLVTEIELGVYVLLILGTLGFQGGTAWFYFSRAKHLEAYRRQTPPWVIELLSKGGV